MAEPKIVNLRRDVEDSATSFGFSPDLEARFARDAVGAESSALSYQKLAPNFRIPFGHRHGSQEEVYVVVAGDGRVKLDDEIVDVEQWDAVRVPKDVVRNFEAGPDGLEFIAFGSPNTGSGDADMLPGWWSD